MPCGQIARGRGEQAARSRARTGLAGGRHSLTKRGEHRPRVEVHGPAGDESVLELSEVDLTQPEPPAGRDDPAVGVTDLDDVVAESYISSICTVVSM